MDITLILCFIVMVIAPYLICGVSSAIIVTKIKSGKDIRTLGSGNAGLTNVLRTQGKTAAAATLVGDAVKGVAAVIIVRLAFRYIAGISTADIENGMNWVAYAAGIMACFGHVFPIYYKFKGGRGVLVTFAVLLAIDWISAFMLFGLFLLIVLISRYVSLGSVVAAVCYPVWVLILSLMQSDPSAYINFACALIIAIILVLMHKGNIIRLINKTERKLGVKE